MKGDFSRNSFDPTKHYSNVRMQQGRVQLDADWNEQMDMVDYRNQLFTTDFLGTAIAPAGDAGFEITTQSNPVNLNIGSGRYYVNGLLVENSVLTSYQSQSDYPNAKLPSYDANNPNNNIYLAYLDVWQRNVSMVNDPSITEVALNGADTSVRTSNIAQVKLMPVLWDGNLYPLTYNNLFNINASEDSNPYQNAVSWQTLLNRLSASSTSQLTPQLNSAPTLQNQFYRVEIHQGSGNVDDQGKPIPPSFKWSRDNASVSATITAISIDPSGNNSSITLTNTVQDGQISLAAGQWLELTTPARELTSLPGDMVQIIAISGATLTVSGRIGIDITPTNYPVAYRWESIDVDINLTAVNDLENGLSIIFAHSDDDPESGTDFSTGDYWLIPARAATSTIIWPQEKGIFQTQFPQGIQQYYTPLAILQCNADGSWTRTDDCRNIATPVSQLNAYGADPEAPSNSVYVDRLGQVGIGTKTPSSKLDVEGNTTINGQLSAAIETTDNKVATITGISTGGRGIYGSSPDYLGVYGQSDSGDGVYGESTSGVGVLGISAHSYGVYGNSTDSIGIVGQSTTSAGVQGYSDSSSGVAGASKTSHGVTGGSDSGVGVYGHSASNYGMAGVSDNSIGVYGRCDDSTQNSNAAGVVGESTGGMGVFGFSSNHYGVMGKSTNSHGVWGVSTSGGIGVYGQSVSNYGMAGVSTNTHGIFGSTEAVNRAGVFGVNSIAYGIYGSTTSGYGVVGDAFTSNGHGTGVYGESKYGVGVSASSWGNVALLATSTNHIGIVGTSKNSLGIWASSFDVGNKNIGLFSHHPSANKVSVADSSGHFTSNWLGDIWITSNIAHVPFTTAQVLISIK